jgi:hypothetical protein
LFRSGPAGQGRRKFMAQLRFPNQKQAPLHNFEISHFIFNLYCLIDILPVTSILGSIEVVNLNAPPPGAFSLFPPHQLSDF